MCSGHSICRLLPAKRQQAEHQNTAYHIKKHGVFRRYWSKKRCTQYDIQAYGIKSQALTLAHDFMDYSDRRHHKFKITESQSVRENQNVT